MARIVDAFAGVGGTLARDPRIVNRGVADRARAVYSRGMTRCAAALAMLFLAACAGPREPVCGEGEEPVILTGLAGLLDGEPAVEVQLVVPETCEVLGETWMFWDEETDTVTLGNEPTEGTLEGAGVETYPLSIFFRALNLGVRLEYAREVPSDDLTLTWFSMGEDLALVHCVGTGGVLVCGVAP